MTHNLNKKVKQKNSKNKKAKINKSIHDTNVLQVFNIFIFYFSAIEEFQMQQLLHFPNLIRWPELLKEKEINNNYQTTLDLVQKLLSQKNFGERELKWTRNFFYLIQGPMIIIGYLFLCQLLM